MIKIKIVADKNILLLSELFAEHSELQILTANHITQSALHDATVLLSRSITPINEQLLSKTSIGYVGTASTGTDHLDKNYLQQQPVRWFNAGGCNAWAVVDYVLCCIAILQQQGLLTGKNIRAGIIGVGRIGGCIANVMTALGFDVVLNDPPRAEMESDFISIPLSDFSDLDLITIHTPLTRSGNHPSYHLINKEFLSTLKPGCILINTARGSVADNHALLNAEHLKLCLDVWENEPCINTDLVQKALFATPHIAGYTLAAKQRATLMLYEKLRTHLHLPKLPMHWQKLLDHRFSYTKFIKQDNWRELTLKALNLASETQRMKTDLIALNNQDDISKAFVRLRESYPLRHELS